MGRKFGPNKDIINDFIRENYKTMSDEQIGLKFGLDKKTIYNRRFTMKLLLGKNPLQSNETIAMVLEYFSNGKTCADICRILRKKPHQIKKIIDTNFFYKKKGYDTITIVLESKINYE